MFRIPYSYTALFSVIHNFVLNRIQTDLPLAMTQLSINEKSMLAKTKLFDT